MESERERVVLFLTLFGLVGLLFSSLLILILLLLLLSSFTPLFVSMGGTKEARGELEGEMVGVVVVGVLDVGGVVDEELDVLPPARDNKVSILILFSSRTSYNDRKIEKDRWMDG